MTTITEPRVELIAHTTLACDGRRPAIEEYMSLDPEAGDAQQQRYHALVGERDEKVKVNRLDY